MAEFRTLIFFEKAKKKYPIIPLVGGWTNPFEKYDVVKLDLFPRDRAENSKNYLTVKPSPRYSLVIQPKAFAPHRSPFFTPFFSWFLGPFLTPKNELFLKVMKSWESKVPPPKLPPQRNKALLMDY